MKMTEEEVQKCLVYLETPEQLHPHCVIVAGVELPRIPLPVDMVVYNSRIICLFPTYFDFEIKLNQGYVSISVNILSIFWIFLNSL